jgi:hypothetical protein
MLSSIGGTGQRWIILLQSHAVDAQLILKETLSKRTHKNQIKRIWKEGTKKNL